MPIFLENQTKTPYNRDRISAYHSIDTGFNYGNQHERHTTHPAAEEKYHTGTANKARPFAG